MVVLTQIPLWLSAHQRHQLSHSQQYAEGDLAQAAVTSACRVLSKQKQKRTAPLQIFASRSAAAAAVAAAAAAPAAAVAKAHPHQQR